MSPRGVLNIGIPLVQPFPCISIHWIKSTQFNSDLVDGIQLEEHGLTSKRGDDSLRTCKITNIHISSTIYSYYCTRIDNYGKP